MSATKFMFSPPRVVFLLTATRNFQHSLNMIQGTTGEVVFQNLFIYFWWTLGWLFRASQTKRGGGLRYWCASSLKRGRHRNSIGSWRNLRQCRIQKYILSRNIRCKPRYRNVTILTVLSSPEKLLLSLVRPSDLHTKQWPNVALFVNNSWTLQNISYFRYWLSSKVLRCSNEAT